MTRLFLPSLTLILAAVLTVAAPAAGTAKDPGAAVVAVVGLDDQGQPVCQGLGAALGQDGKVVTSANLLAHSRGGVVKTASGALHLINRVLWRDDLQDLALIKVEADRLVPAPPGVPGKVRPGQKLLVGKRREQRLSLEPAAAAGVYPLSPRLTLLQLKDGFRPAEPGAPVFTESGELVGLLHSFRASPGQAQNLHLVLLHDFSRLPLKEPLPDEASRPDGFEAAKNGGGYDGFWWGVAANLNREWRRAEEAFSAALASKPDLSEACYGRGVARHHLGDQERALADLMAAVKKAPSYALAWLWAGRTWERRGERDQAREAYLKAADQAPDLSEAWFQLGILAYQAGDLGRAQEHFSRVRDDCSRSAEGWWHLGQIARARQESERALAAFQRSMALDPEFSPAYLDGGKILLELGRPAEAARLLAKLVNREPRRAQARYYLAQAHISSWNAGQAWEQYFTLLELNPVLAARLSPLLESFP